MQILPQEGGGDPKVFVGYGLNAAWTEFDANGTVLCDVHFGARTSFERGDVQSYRSYKFEWQGRPMTPPSTIITDDDSEILVSWNGATEVAEWLLQSSNSKAVTANWTDVQQAPKHKFETAMALPPATAEARYLRVVALSETGHQLEHGTSKVVDRGIMASYFPSINKKISKDVTHMSTKQYLLIIAFNISALFVLYEAYRKYLVWRHGRASGPVMFRKGPVYRLLGDA